MRILKLLIYIFVIFAVLAGIFFGVRFYFQKDNEAMIDVQDGDLGVPIAPEVPGGGFESNGADQEARENGALGLTPVSQEPVFDYWINRSDGSVYYILETGAIYRVEATGSDSELVSSLGFEDLNYMKPSPSGEQMLLAFGPAQKPSLRIFNAVSRSWRSLPAGIYAAAWHPEEGRQEIAYLQRADGDTTTTAGIIALETGVARELVDLDLLDVTLDWPVANSLILASRPTRMVLGGVWEFKIGERILTRLIAARGFLANWGQDGRALIASTEENNLLLYSLTANTALATNIKTLPEKCALTSALIYCGVPKDALTKYPDAYLQKAQFTQDSIAGLMIEGDSLSPTFAAGSALILESMDVWHPWAHDDALYFINRYDSRVYRLDLAISR